MSALVPALLSSVNRLASHIGPSPPFVACYLKQFLLPTVGQHCLDTLQIAIGDQYVDVQMTLPLSRFFGQNMARIRMATLDLAGRGQTKSLCRAFMCFQFGHNCSFGYIENKILSPSPHHRTSALWGNQPRVNAGKTRNRTDFEKYVLSL